MKRADIFARMRIIGCQEGASVVELALIMGILGPLILLGTAQISFLIYASIEVSDATHAAASYAAAYYHQNSSTLPAQSAITTAATIDAPELSNMLQSGTSFTAVMATGCGTGSATTGNTVSCTAGVLPYVQVTGTATVVPPFQYLAIPRLTMTSKAVVNLVN